MKLTNKIVFFGLVTALVFASCAKPPVEEMDAATAALTRAENDPDAKLYAQNGITRARDSLNNMRAEAEQKHYPQALQLAKDTVDLAERAISDGKNVAARMREDAANAIRAMETAITETKATIDNARTQRLRGVTFSQIDSDFAATQAIADQARLANGSNRYREAVDSSQTVRSQLSNISTTIAQAAQSLSRKK
jgi:predicted kinase